MDFKSLFIKDDSPESEKPREQKNETISFPEEKAAPSFPNPTAPSSFPQSASQPMVSGNTFYNEVLNVYVSGLESLNQEGIEFYEVLKAVEAVDINNAAAYKMAIQMLQNVDKNFSKDKALSTSQFYLDSVIKAHQDFQRGGNDKKQRLLNDKATETDSLNKEILSIEGQISQLTETLSQKRMELSTIDSKYQVPLNEVEGKLQANDMAKETVLNKLNTVVQNLKNS